MVSKTGGYPKEECNGKFQKSPGPGGENSIKSSVFLAFAGFIILLAICGIASANPPADVQLSYSEANYTLQVTILHIVQDPSTHFIRTVELRKNGQLVGTEDYTSQPSVSSPFTYRYSIPAAPGDTLEATAICNIAGSRAAMMVVPGTGSASSPSQSEPTGTTVPLTTRAGLSLLIPFAALAGAGLALFFRRD